MNTKRRNRTPGEYLYAGKIIASKGAGKSAKEVAAALKLMEELNRDKRPFIQKHQKQAESIAVKYFKENKSVSQIARELKVSPALVIKRMDMFGLRRREGGAVGGSWYSSLSQAEKEQFNREASKRALEREARKKASLS